MSLDPVAEAKSAAISGVHSPNAEKLCQVRKRLECATAREMLAIVHKLIDADRRWIGCERESAFRVFGIVEDL